MIARKISDIKTFMNILLRSEVFDHFLLQEAVITTAATYTIQGNITKDFYSKEELEELHLQGQRFLPFSMLRSQCFDLIKGKRTPAAFRFLFLLSPKRQEKTIAAINSSYTASNINAMYLNLKYQNGQLILTTGIAYAIFSTDKTLENEWDKMILRFLEQQNIAFEEI